MSQDFRLYERVKSLELELDSMRGLVHNLRQGQQDMLDQIKILKEKVANDDCK